MATVGPCSASTWASRSFVLVLPEDPVTATTRSPGTRSHHLVRDRAERRLDVVDDQGAQLGGRPLGQHRDGAALDGLRDVVHARRRARRAARRTGCPARTAARR